MFKRRLLFLTLLLLAISKIYAYTVVEDALLTQKNYPISGTFGHYDFKDVDDAFDWVYQSVDGTFYQLQGETPTQDDLFGWKKVSISSVEASWYLIALGSDVDGDGTQKFDWVLFFADSSHKMAYKLSGVAANGTFTYSDTLALNYEIHGENITISSADEQLELMSATECDALATLMIQYNHRLDVEQPTPSQITQAIASSHSSASCKAVEALVYYLDEDNGYNQDYTKAMRLFQVAAAEGNVLAQTRIGIMYEYGLGVEVDYTQAKMWYDKAARYDYPDAFYHLGDLYYYANGVEQDYLQAKYWYDKAAVQGHSDAQWSLGTLYDFGNGVAQDYTQAKFWYETAVLKGNSSAQNDLGVLYLWGRGVEQNSTTARTWFEKAAQKDNINALENLGWMYYEGQGVFRDLELAKEYYQRAADLGSESAQKMLDNFRYE
jgi:TPR repeat protein